MNAIHGAGRATGRERGGESEVKLSHRFEGAGFVLRVVHDAHRAAARDGDIRDGADVPDAVAACRCELVLRSGDICPAGPVRITAYSPKLGAEFCNPPVRSVQELLLSVRAAPLSA